MTAKARLPYLLEDSRANATNAESMDTRLETVGAMGTRTTTTNVLMESAITVANKDTVRETATRKRETKRTRTTIKPIQQPTEDRRTSF